MKKKQLILSLLIFTLSAILTNAIDLSFSGNTSINEGETVNISLITINQIGNVTYEIVDNGGADFLSINTSSESVTGQASEWDSGSYNIVINASDNVSYDSKNLTLTINDILPALDLLPIADKTTNEGDNLIMPFSYKYNHGNTTFNLSKGNATFLELNQGKITGSIPSDAKGTYKISLTASDDLYNDTENFTLTINEVQPKISVTETILIGGPNQERSNPNSDDESDKDISASKKFVISNQGDENITNIVFEVVLDGWSQNEVNISFSDSNFNLSKGENKTITITGRIPENIDAVNSKNYEPESQFIGTLKVSGKSVSKIVEDTAKINMQAENKLDISEVEVCVGDDCETGKNNKTLENIKPKDTVDITVVVKNKFNEKSNLEIEDGTIELITDGDIDVNEEEDMSDLAVDSEESVLISFDVDEDSEGIYEVLIVSYGKDENGALHADKMIFEIRINKESHEIKIDSFDLEPELTCNLLDNNQKISAIIDLENIGKNDENYIEVKIESKQLKLNEILKGVSIDKGSEKTERINFNVPENIEEGNYDIKATVYYNNKKQTISKTVKLVIPDCKKESEKEDIIEKETPFYTTQNESEKTINPKSIKKENKTSLNKQQMITIAWIVCLEVILCMALIIIILKKNLGSKD